MNTTYSNCAKTKSKFEKTTMRYASTIASLKILKKTADIILFSIKLYNRYQLNISYKHASPT